MKKNLHVFVFLYVVLLCLNVACAELSTEKNHWKYNGPINVCVTDADCLPDNYCHEARHICASMPSLVDDLYAKVIPDQTLEKPLLSQIYHLAISERSRILAPFNLLSQVKVNGVITIDNNDSIDARLIFTDLDNSLPGHSPKVTVHNSLSPNIKHLWLLPGLYNVMIIPQNKMASKYPIVYIDSIVVDLDGLLRDSKGGEEVVIHIPSKANRVSGYVYYKGIALDQSPVKGLKIVALHPVSKRILSTQAYTDAAGKFSINLSVDAISFNLQASRPNEPSHPVYLFDEIAAPSHDTVLSKPFLLKPLGVPILFNAIVEIEKSNLMNAPSPFCQVSITSTNISGGTVERWIGTNESGALEDSVGTLGVHLYAGDYSIKIIPPALPDDAPIDYTTFVSTQDTPILKNTSADPLTFMLQKRVKLNGTVSMNGTDVPFSTISAEPCFARSNPERSNFARSNLTATSQSGKYQMWLDRSKYFISAEAPAESRYAWGYSIFDIASEILESESIDLKLAIPIVVDGIVANHFNQEVSDETSGAVIEWYRNINGYAFLIGRTTSDKNGNFSALLPSILKN